MPDVKIIAEVTGRVCAIAAEVGGAVSEGDDVVFVEAMKMEIPVSAPAGGTIKSIMVKVDDVVAEGQAVAILES